MPTDKKSQPVKNYSFTLVLSGVKGLTPELEDALFEAGCDDALLGVQDGVVFLDFDREAASLRAAVSSAIADVESAGLGPVARVEPDDMVTASEIARRVSRSRQSIQQLLSGVRGPGDFPRPVGGVKGRSPVWRWGDVLRWFTDHPERAGRGLDLAKEYQPAIAATNAALELRHLLPVDEAVKLLRELARHKAGRPGAVAGGGAKRKSSSATT